MSFNSLEFVFFFPLVTLLHFLCPQRARWATLLLASCYFYMVFYPPYILVLLFTILVDYGAGILIAGSAGRKRKFYLAASIVANVGTLTVFKYAHFLAQNLNWLTHSTGFGRPLPVMDILLPLGLSFHVFQSLSYTIEVYRGNQKAETHLGVFALYVMFFPQLVAGPIERPQHMLHQFRETHVFEYGRVTSGLRLMAWGFFKKLVIADQCGWVVDIVYTAPGRHSGAALLAATVLFAYQIYCDFSGYSDIAIGAARVMGFNLMRNFDRPYAAASLPEFWRRWHISLSTWFRDYLYIPMGGSRVSRPRWRFNLLVTFLVSGLWHGPNWTFLAWGLFHGVGVLATDMFTGGTKRQSGVPKAIGVFTTFSVVCIGWTFFRASCLRESVEIIAQFPQGMLTLLSCALHPANIPGVLSELRLTIPTTIVLGGAVAILECVEWLRATGRVAVQDVPTPVRWVAYYGLVLAILAFGVFGRSSFIYFQF